MSTTVAAASGLGAAALFAGGTALQYRAATDAGPSGDLGARAVLAFARRSFRHPRWLGGTVLLGAGLGLHALALHAGPLTLVQPLLVAGVLFTLPLSRLAGGPPLRRSDLGWAVALVGALTVFLLTATPATQRTGVIDAGPAAAAAACGLAGIVVCVAVARRRPDEQTALALGIAAGIALAGSAAMIKVTTDVAARGVGVVLTGWQLYALLAVGGVALLLSQLAYRAGPMVTSLPAINVANPLMSAVIGTIAFDERFRTGIAVTPVEVVALLVVLVATAALSRRSPEAAGGPPGAPPRPPIRATPSGRCQPGPRAHAALSIGRMAVPVIQTDRLTLRPLTADDLDALAALHAEPSFWWFPLGRGQTRIETEAFLEQTLARYDDDGLGVHGVVERESGALSGWAGLSVPRFLPEVLPAVEVGWRLGEAYRGRGYATEAGAATMRWGFEERNLDRIVSIYEPGNVASGAVMERLGLSLDRVTSLPGRELEVHVLVLTAGRWEQLDRGGAWPAPATHRYHP